MRASPALACPMLTLLWSTAAHATPAVLFVHGMYVTGASWAPWRAALESRGHETLAPSWPCRDGAPAALREAPDPCLESLTLSDVVDQFEAIVRAQPEPPILIGHSMGGLVVQLLLDRGLGHAGVAIDSAPPRGLVSTRWSFLRSTSPFLWPTRAPLPARPRRFRYMFTHTLSEAASREVFETHVVPESRRVGRGPTTRAGRIDFGRERAPLLLVAGGQDRTIPAALTRRNHRRQSRSPAPTDLIELEEATHWTVVGEPGWEITAEHVLDWLDQLPPG